MSVKWREYAELIVYVPAPAPSVARTTVPRATTVAYTTSVSTWTAVAESRNAHLPLRSSVLRSTDELEQATSAAIPRSASRFVVTVIEPRAKQQSAAGEQSTARQMLQLGSRQ